MSRTFDLKLLAEIAAEVIGVRELRLDPTMTVADVEGWDSLNQTLVALEISNRFAIELSAESLARCANLEAIVALVSDTISRTV
ncbi:MAG: acyl carrier protein [Alphaproteobacteria bacterium]